MRSWQEELALLKATNTPDRRPFVTAAFAMSRDGCLTETRGRSTRISGPESMQLTHELRASHDALMVGVGTVLTDDPQLTTRLVTGPSPLRVVLDSQLRLPLTARVLHSTERPPWLVTTPRAPRRRAQLLAAEGARLLRVSGADQGVCVPELLTRLYERGVRSVMLEGGAAVLESFFRAQCVDYVALTVSPRALANPAAVTIGRCTSMALTRMHASSREQVGDDRFEAGPLLAEQPHPAHVRVPRLGLHVRSASVGAT
ncbi:MAG: dihydrofolate reductase family protein [Polyangiales bacterium]